MQTLAWIVGIVLVVAALVLGLPWFSDRMTRGGSGGGGGGNPLGVMSEIFNPGAAKSQIVIEQMKERKSSDALGSGDDGEDGEEAESHPELEDDEPDQSPR